MEKKPSRKRKRTKRLKSLNKKLLHEKDDSAAVEEIDERQEEEKEPSASASAKRTKSQGFSKSSSFLDKAILLLHILIFELIENLVDYFFFSF